jgi:hypothetical protein
MTSKSLRCDEKLNESMFGDFSWPMSFVGTISERIKGYYRREIGKLPILPRKQMSNALSLARSAECRRGHRDQHAALHSDSEDVSRNW